MKYIVTINNSLEKEIEAESLGSAKRQARLFFKRNKNNLYPFSIIRIYFNDILESACNLRFNFWTDFNQLIILRKSVESNTII